jgi:hypothetical protein
MKLRSVLATLALTCCSAWALPYQNNAPAPAPAPAQNTTPRQAKAPMQQAPGGGPDKVWVNASSKVYHCPNDRYYGKTKNGKYMTEADAKAAGAHGVNGQTCFK